MNSIDALKTIPKIIGPKEAPVPGNSVPADGSSFMDTLNGFIKDVNEMQATAAEKTTQFATGEIKDIHEVMAAAEEANISLMLLMELRNKALDGYKELMRTPV